jgi:hypothetical protein
MLAEQLSGVRALGVELLGLLTLAIRVPVDSLSAFVIFPLPCVGQGNGLLTCTPSAARCSPPMVGSTECCRMSSRGSHLCRTRERAL